MSTPNVRRARTGDVPAMLGIIEPLVSERILLGKERVDLYGAIQEFRVAEDGSGQIIGLGALHVIWSDLGEIRTIAAHPDWLGKGVGHALLESLVSEAREIGLSRLFCLTFETEFFARHGFTYMGDEVVDPEVFQELLRSRDDGVAEFLDLARVKQNTLGNTRMLRTL